MKRALIWLVIQFCKEIWRTLKGEEEEKEIGTWILLLMVCFENDVINAILGYNIVLYSYPYSPYGLINLKQQCLKVYKTENKESFSFKAKSWFDNFEMFL